jgi:dihydroorotate dehydrogenase (fumarate)
MVLSTPDELRPAAALDGPALWPNPAQVALSTARPLRVGRGQGAAAGAQVVQTASALLQHGIPYLSTMLRQIEGWMGEHEYARLKDFRGKLSQKESPDPFAYERAQYVRLLSSQK